MDFTLSLYIKLLNVFIENKYQFVCCKDYFEGPLQGKVIMMRHDVDKDPLYALKVAEIEHEMGIKSSYYFRIHYGRKKIDLSILESFAKLGHEVGYHYETLSKCNNDYESAIEMFNSNLQYIRRVYDVKTMCMHGSPISSIHNMDLWHKYDYKKYDILGDLYLDFDYKNIFYLTDTGRTWNGRNRIRDFVKSQFDVKVKSTPHLIELIKLNQLPATIHINTHIERWTDDFSDWCKELVYQNSKNVIKAILKKVRN